MKNELRTRIQIFIVGLNNLVGFLGIEAAASIHASSETELHRLENGEDVREEYHCSLCKYDRRSDSKVPLIVELVEHANQHIRFAVFSSKLLRPQEAVVSQKNNQGSVDILGNEDRESCRLVVSCT